MYKLNINQCKSNNISFKSNNNEVKDTTLEGKISKSVKKLYDRSEREIAGYDYFKPVQVGFKNPDQSLYVGDVNLKISQPLKESGPKYKTQRYLEAVVYSPTKGQNVSLVISQGNKKEILEKLKDPSLIKELEEFIKESSSMFISI